ncbi:restriction endonuclease subunit S [Vibrio alginolyticus]|uniref:restriction endonuclease subunit S n=1 Tax=Vibrio diabolicus TaxID=50719 RepID=UPI003ED50B93
MSWPLVKLGDICETTQGVQITKSHTQSELYEGGFRYLYIADFISDKKLSFVDDVFEKKKVTTDDLVMANTGSPGRVFKGKEGILSNNLFKITFDKGVVDRDYLYLILSSEAFQSVLQQQMKGGIQKHLGHQTISRQEIPLPPLDEQKRIAAILDKADAIRQKRKQAIDLADGFLRSVFLDMFGDPVTNPKGFPVKVLSQLYIDPKNGTKCGPFGSALKKEEFVDEGIPVWNMDNISLSGNFKDEPKLWVTEEKFNEIDAYSVIDGDVIISRAGTVGKMGVVRTKYSSSLISTNLIRVRFSEDLLPEYFVALMTYCKGRVGRLKTGPDGSFTHMNTGILDKLEFPYPPVELQRKFLKLLADTEKYLDKMPPSQLNDLFNSLSQKAFSGQL